MIWTYAATGLGLMLIGVPPSLHMCVRFVLLLISVTTLWMLRKKNTILPVYVGTSWDVPDMATVVVHYDTLYKSSVRLICYLCSTEITMQSYEQWCKMCPFWLIWVLIVYAGILLVGSAVVHNGVQAFPITCIFLCQGNRPVNIWMRSF